MIFFFGGSLVVVSVYAIYMLWLSLHWKWNRMEQIPTSSSVTLIVPYRNEESTLPELLKNLSNVNFPKNRIQILLIDDHSNDDSKKIVEDFILSEKIFESIQLHESKGKKQAISKGVDLANHELIVTIDADCLVRKNWLNTIVSYYEEKAFDYLVLPIKFQSSKSFWERIQALEFSTLVGSGLASMKAGKALMSNGGNVAFKKSAFLKVNGFDGNENIASGDDLFLMFKMEADPSLKVEVLIDQKALVKTPAVKGFNAFINQRIRWASKTPAYQSLYAKFVALLVALANVMILILFIATVFSFISSKQLLLIVAIKFIADFSFFIRIKNFFEQEHLCWITLPLSLIYPCYIVLILVLSLFYNPSWKGRSIS